jgi:hypothetical protein
MIRLNVSGCLVVGADSAYLMCGGRDEAVAGFYKRDTCLGIEKEHILFTWRMGRPCRC